MSIPLISKDKDNVNVHVHVPVVENVEHIM